MLYKEVSLQKHNSIKIIIIYIYIQITTVYKKIFYTLRYKKKS